MRHWLTAKTVKLWEFSAEEVCEMESWILQNIGKRYSQSAGHFHFRTKKDCAYFMLRWS